MNGQPAAIYIIGFLTEQIEKLGITHADDKIKGIVGVRDNNKQRRFPVAQGIQLQLIIL